MEPDSPERLFARYALTGDPNALAEVFDRTAPELLRLALHLSNEADADDLLQAYQVRLELRRPLRYYPSLGLGTHVIEISLKDGRRFSGSFTVEDLQTTETPLEIPMHPLRQ